MINLFNHAFLTQDERKMILARAVASQPYFANMDFEIIAGAEKDRQYKSKLHVDKDFYITDIRGNFNEVFNETGTEFWLSIWESYKGESIHKYMRSQYLPSSFQSFEARRDIAFVQQRYCDLQQEINPYLIRRGNSVLASIDNVGVKAQPADCKIVLAGYYATGRNYLSPRTIQAVNESLAGEPDIEIFPFRVTTDSITSQIVKNDRFARVILGFGVTDLETNKANLANSTVMITDFARKLKWNDEPIPLEYFAPRLTCLRDTHYYSLPIEFLFEPFDGLRFEFNTDLNTGAGFEFSMITRKV